MIPELQVVYSDAECIHCSAPLVFMQADSGEILAVCEECRGVYRNEQEINDGNRKPPKLQKDGSVPGPDLHIGSDRFAQPDDVEATAWAELMGDEVPLSDYLDFKGDEE